MGYIDDAQQNCSSQDNNDEQQSIQLIQQNHQQQQPQDLMTTEQLQQELINDIIVNDLVIIDGSCLQQTTAPNDGNIDCHYEKDGQINENYYIQHCHESDTVSNATINESSNEVCSHESLDHTIISILFYLLYFFLVVFFLGFHQRRHTIVWRRHNNDSIFKIIAIASSFAAFTGKNAHRTNTMCHRIVSQ